MTRSGIRLFAVGALAAATTLASIVALWALQSGGSAQLGGLRLMLIAAGADRRAEPLLAAGSRPTRSDLRTAAELSRLALSQFPYDISAWLRLAYIDTLQNGELTPAGLADLKRSYDLVAVDPVLGIWRIGFALEHSPSLSPEVRKMVRYEATALWSHWRTRAQLEQLARNLRDPAGRLSLTLWLNGFERSVAK